MAIATVSTQPTSVVGIRFQKLGKLYHFGVPYTQRDDIRPGDHVIVDTRRGSQLGQVIAFIDEAAVNRRRKIYDIERKATPRDLVMKQFWEAKDLDALITCRDQAHQLGIRDTTFVKTTYSYDGSWITVYYTTESKSVNLNALRANLGRILRARVELQMIGPRDVAKYLGGFGACGGPRCCSTFLTDFSPISIKMAKEQGVSLSPQEITGMCGRLRCCLVFEYEQYVAAKKQLPRPGKRIGTPKGEGLVLDQLALKDAVRVRVGEEIFEFSRQQLEPLDELEALQKKSEAGCSRHENGGCDCGAAKQKSEDEPQGD